MKNYKFQSGNCYRLDESTARTYKARYPGEIVGEVESLQMLRVSISGGSSYEVGREAGEPLRDAHAAEQAKWDDYNLGHKVKVRVLSVVRA